VCGNAIDYSFKFADRRKLDMLFEKRGNCDDIIIVKNGNITDSYVANLIFFDGQTWRTPDTPLLPGTQRAKLLYEGKISECKITPDDLTKYKKVGLINALNNFDEMQCVDIANILE
jgi:4-amino-4-deoxychorismate lyase